MLKENTFVGEEALLLETVRNAYVRVGGTEPLEVLALSKDDLNFVLDDYPALADVIMMPMAEREVQAVEDEVEAEAEEEEEDAAMMAVLGGADSTDGEAAAAAAATAAAAAEAEAATEVAAAAERARLEEEELAQLAMLEAQQAEEQEAERIAAEQEQAQARAAAAAAAAAETAAAEAEAAAEGEAARVAEQEAAQLEILAAVEAEEEAAAAAAAAFAVADAKAKAQIQAQLEAAAVAKRTIIPEGQPKRRHPKLTPPPSTIALWQPPSAQPAATSWLVNLGTTNTMAPLLESGADARWVDLHIERVFPACSMMVREMAMAAPPCGAGSKVLDLFSGATLGRASACLLDAYPNAELTLHDTDAARLAVASERLNNAGHSAVATEHGPPMTELAGGGYTLVVLAMGLSRALITEHGASPLAEGQALESHAGTLRGVLAALAPGGHCILAERASDGLSAYGHVRLMEEVGFEEVDVAWKQRGQGQVFVCGGRKPQGL